VVGLNRELVAVAEKTILQTQQALAVAAANRHPPVDQDIVLLSSLRETTRRLTDIVQSFNSASEDYILARLASIGKQAANVQHLLAHFDSEIKSIVRDVLENTTDVGIIFWKVLEKCYNEAVSNGGALHSDDYHNELAERQLQSPYDPDYESEAYYEHENQLLVDEDYAEADHLRLERESDERDESMRRTYHIWTRFWIQALAQCPGGPTLFCPPADCWPEIDLADLPHFLFRAFDPKSSGHTDDTVVTSKAKVQLGSREGSIDFFSLSGEKASGSLGAHLLWCEGEYPDNFMSWSSSLVFVIQYAIWRRRKYTLKPSDVQICAVDIKDFPQGQFIRDSKLIHFCRERFDKDENLEGAHRIRMLGWENGEYLSQGTLCHQNRSCVVSLQSLIQKGLFRLYPEFNSTDASGRNLWTKRVQQLRSSWSEKGATSQQEINDAVNLAKACFPSFVPAKIALVFLAFKNRAWKDPSTEQTASLFPSLDTAADSTRYENYGPGEVQRYHAAIESLRLRSQTKRISMDSPAAIMLEQFFELGS
jgi:hypothetical protein